MPTAADGEGLPKVLIVGAGLSGAVLARMLAEGGVRAVVFEERPHIAGHCYTERDRETGVIVHRHGPHTLHTDDAAIWAFIERFAAIHPYRHVKAARVGDELFPLPINLQTLNQFFRRALTPAKARDLIAAEVAESNQNRAMTPANFEEAALATIGRKLYEAFYRGYTIKQWGVAPRELPAYVFGRLPIRFNYDQNYFHHSRQGQPIGGFTPMVEKILAHENIELHLSRAFDPAADRAGYRHVFYSGPIDRYFGWRHGRLAYRTLRFEEERLTGDAQGCSVINYCDEAVPYTRVTEHKHFSSWEKPEGTVVSYEYSTDCGPDDNPYYPVRLAKDRAQFGEYVAEAEATPGVTFIGRLGTYRYIDMDVAISEAMTAAGLTLAALREGRGIPAFFVKP
jgi:UDP-galactopyranose mutase